MEKVYIYTHGNDIDGIGCLILAKLAFDNPSYSLASNIAELEAKFEESIIRPKPSSHDENKVPLKCRLDDYNKIYVTDLCFHKNYFERLKEEPGIFEKTKVFDHHAIAIKEGCNEYSNVSIVETDDSGKKRCATDLFYEYLVSQGLLKKTKALDDFVELTRLEDTWDWKKAGKEGIKAHNLAILFNALKSDGYRKSVMRVLDKTESFTLLDADIEIIEKKKQEDMAQLQKLWNDAEIFTDCNNNTFAAVFANYEYRNELAEYVQSLIETGRIIEAIKYLVVIALEKGQFGQRSYRSIENGFNVGKIAELHGGGGHESAASSNITEEMHTHVLTLNRRDALKYLVNN